MNWSVGIYVAALADQATAHLHMETENKKLHFFFFYFDLFFINLLARHGKVLRGFQKCYSIQI